MRGMRFAGVVASCVALLTLVGCDSRDSQYFRNGIGTNLYSDDIGAISQYQDLYLAELCRQASPALSVGPESSCAAGFPWTLIVQAGLNDIDRRCDGYLAWLDDRKRTNNAVLKQLGDLAVASQGIMRLAGVGANPITIAGLAFGLASDTFTNINSRLLLEVDKTTVQTLVMRRRNDYRIALQDPRLIIDSKPAAIHALRSYLTICTPFTIETDINSTVTVYQSGGSPALDQTPPLVDPNTVGVTRVVYERLSDLASRIRAFSNASAANQTAVEKWMKARNITMPIRFFLTPKANSKLQQQMVVDLKIP